jgi:RHS repeat-associated protein
VSSSFLGGQKDASQNNLEVTFPTGTKLKISIAENPNLKYNLSFTHHEERAMRRFFVLAALFGLTFLIAEDPRNPSVPFLNAPQVTSLDGEPSGFVDGVNVISGEFVDHEVDLVIAGPKPLFLERTLLNNNSGPSKYPSCEHWHFAEGGKINTPHNPASSQYCISYLGPSAESYYFVLTPSLHVLESFAHPDILKKGVTNTSAGAIAASTNIRNNKIIWDGKKNMSIISSEGIQRLAHEVPQNFPDDPLVYRINTELHPNMLKHCFQHISGNSVSIHEMKNWIDVSLGFYLWEFLKSGRICHSCDGRRVEYSYNKQHWDGNFSNVDLNIPAKKFLTQVVRPSAPQVNYEYYPGRVYHSHMDWNPPYTEYPKLRQKIYPCGRVLEFHYYWEGDNHLFGHICKVGIESPLLSRISYLRAPLGLSADLHVKQKFFYYLPEGKKGMGITTVYDALDRKTDYHFNARKRLLHIKKYSLDSSLYSQETLHWGPNDTPHEIELQGRSFHALGDPGLLYFKKYTYDGLGNILQDTLYGNLTGRSLCVFTLDGNRNIQGQAESFTRSYSYVIAPLHLLTQSTEGEVTRTFTYYPNTTLVASECHSNAKGIYLRHFYIYDYSGSVVEAITDDGNTPDRNNLAGVTERKIQRTHRSNTFPFGMPLVVTDTYLENGVEKKLSEERNTYDSFGRLVHKIRCDSQGNPIATESWSYDTHGNCLSYTDPMGAVTISSYDFNDNKISETKTGCATKRYVYDFMNRLIATYEDHKDGTLATLTRYDFVGNAVETIDAFGNSTLTDYDAFNRPIKITYPPLPSLERPVTQYTFDPFNRPTTIIDALGNKTTFRYTLRGKPCHIRYPDGTEEFFYYDLQGNLVEQVDKLGTKTLYERDHLGRIVKKTVLSPSGECLCETKAGYNTFHLLWETDPEGLITTYLYDLAGRKVRETKGEISTSYTYDTAGRLFTKTTGQSVIRYLYDPMGQVVQETSETLAGTILTQKNCVYDYEGRPIEVSYPTAQGTATIKTTYDTHSIPIETIDPNGAKTTRKLILNYINAQGQHVPALESTDPLGNKTLAIQNTHGKTVQEEIYDPFNRLMQKTTHTYNRCGLKIGTTRSLLQNGEPQYDQQTLWEYDVIGRPTAYIQAAATPSEKRTTYAYDLAGRLITETFPSGISLLFEYDPLGRKTRSASSDGAIDYATRYDKCSRPLETLDKILGTKTLRSYDSNGNLISETLGNGLTSSYTYQDALLTQITLPDTSTITYCYEGPLLRKVTRSTPTTTYYHSYTGYDHAGRLLEETLPFNLGVATRAYTLKGQLTQITAPQFTQSLAYNPLAHLTQRTTSDPQGDTTENFGYDPLHQLTTTSQNTYAYDSLYNRTSTNNAPSTISPLNQLLSDGASTYTYGLAGELQNIAGPHSAAFTYDSLQRLTSLEKDGLTLRYTYDELGRILTASTYQNNLLLSQENRLYFGLFDIGSYSPQGDPLLLRVLGERKCGDIGSAIAIEILGTPHIPLHDHQGNTALLLTPDGALADSYRYTPFGEETHLNSSNPYRFSSKRTELGFLNFGHRFYDPRQGRWLTPDPLNDQAGPNPYAFLHNNPLTSFDPYGLFAEENKGFFDRARDFFNHCRDTIKGCLSRAFECTRDTFRSIGNGLHEFSKHAIPFPVVKDVPALIGHAIAHGSFRGYTPSWQGPKSHYCGPNHSNPRTPYQGNIALVINGVNNTHEEAMAAIEMVRKLGIAERTEGIYIRNNGIAGGVFCVAGSKIGFKTEATRTVLESIRSSIEAIGGVNSEYYVILIAFSQGGQEVHHAMQYLSPEEKARIAVIPLGTAKIILDKQTAFCHNYIDSKDMITLVADPINFLATKLGLIRNVTILESKEKELFTHRFGSDTYQGALRDAKLDLIDKGIIKCAPSGY